MNKFAPTLLALSTTLLAAQAVIPALPTTSDADPTQITVDLSKPVGPYRPTYGWFGYDEANYTTMPNGRKLLRELHDLSPVPVYIRAHHLFTSGNGIPELKWSSTNVYSEDAAGHAIYDFTLLDGIFDAYQAAGVRPMVELGFMPKDLAANLPDRSEPYQVHYPRSTIAGASNNPPKDYAKWGELVRTVTAHLVDRYGRDTVSHWYFEVWNEPDIDYWHSTPENYWKLYDYSVASVRKALPAAKVGGPASTGPGNAHAAAFLTNFLTHVETGRSAATGGRIPLDFISFHVKGQPQIPQSKPHTGQVRMGLSKELLDADSGFAIVAKFPRFQHLPIILSEADPEGCAACSSKVNPANNYRNGTLYPAYTAAAYKALFELADRRHVNLLAMLSWSFEFEGKDYFEGFRSLATNSIDKPILNFFRMAALMDGTRVRTTSNHQVPLDAILASSVRETPDIDAFATTADHHASILVWNYHDLAEATPGSTIGSAPGSATGLHIEGLPASARRVLVTHYRIDDTHSNAYTLWKNMGSPQQPSAAQYAQLQGASGLELLGSPAWIDVHNGNLNLHTDLPRHAVSLLQVRWQ